MIHPTAIIHPKAKLDATVEMGPYAVIDENVTLGAGCKVGPHVYITGNTQIGANNRFYAGAVIGEAPQDVKYKDTPTRLRIGDNNIFREHVTVHRSTKEEDETVLGSNNFLMANSHVAHNVVIGNQVILANGALLAGHVQVADRVFISGNCLVHQFTRIGTLSLMQGGAGIGQDLPPFTIASGINSIRGLNIIGLRRAGFSAAERLELKELYHALFRTPGLFSQLVATAQEKFTGAPSRTMLDFVASSKRGVCRDFGRASGAEEAEH